MESTSRRDVIRKARQQERAILEARDALSREGLLEQVKDKVEDWVNRAIAENGIHDIRHITQQVCSDARYHVESSRMPPEASNDLCAFCKNRVEHCYCGGSNTKVQTLPQHLLDDEYALLALAKADAAKAEERKSKLDMAARRQAYAAELQNLMAEKERQRQAAELEKQRDKERLQRDAEALRREQFERESAQRRQRAQCADELDYFCAVQQRNERTRLDEARAEEQRLNALAAAKQREEEKRAARQREQNRLQLLRDQQMYEEQLQERKQQEEAERQQDREYMRQAEERDREREAQRHRDRESVLSKQQQIYSSMGAELGRVERERREALESAFARWEQERQQHDIAVASEKEREQRLAIQDLNRSRQQQIMEQAAERERVAVQQAAYARELEFKSRLEQEQEHHRKMQQLARRDQYKSYLEFQVIEEERTRKERQRIGMNDVERKMNASLLRQHNLLTETGRINTCWTGRCQGVCTCPRAIREQRYHHF